MGACGICKSVITTRSNMTSSLINSWSYSTSSYSGVWNTCYHISRFVKVADKYTDAKKKSFLKKDCSYDNVEKGRSVVYDLGAHHYELWTTKKVVKKSKVAPKYEYRYIVRDKAYTTLTEANKNASLIALTNGESVSVKKQKVLVKGSEDYTNFEIVKKEYKTKPKHIKAGGVLKEGHYYIVVGMAVE